MHNDKRRLIKHALLLSAMSLLPFSLIGQAQAAETVKVGIIHSLTGTMAISEASVVTPRNWPSMKSTPAVAYWARPSNQSSKTVPVTGRPSPRRRASCWKTTRSQ